MTNQMVVRKFGADIEAGVADIRKNETVSALDYLQSIYRDPLQVAGVRMRAAAVALPRPLQRCCTTSIPSPPHWVRNTTTAWWCLRILSRAFGDILASASTI